METTRAASLNTHLKDRTLWYDGESSFNPNNLIYWAARYNVQFVDYMITEIEVYNQNVTKEHEIRVKSECSPLNFEWILPAEYKQLDVVEYLFDKHTALVADMDVAEADKRDIRLSQEILMYKQQNLLGVLRTIIYIINTLSTNGIVWGVGRGSSVSSYVLYVIGAHDVDSYAYDLDITDFLHE